MKLEHLHVHCCMQGGCINICTMYDETMLEISLLGEWKQAHLVVQLVQYFLLFGVAILYCTLWQWEISQTVFKLLI